MRPSDATTQTYHPEPTKATLMAREDLEKCGLIKQVPSAPQLYLAQWPLVPP